MSVSVIQSAFLLIKNENDLRERLARQKSPENNRSLGNKSITGECNSRSRSRYLSPEAQKRLEEFAREEREHFERVALERPVRKKLLEEVSKKSGDCDLEKAKQLLEQVTVNKDRPGDKFGVALFNKAVSLGHLEIVRAVISKGANPNPYDIRDAVSVAQNKGYNNIKAFLVAAYPKVIAEYLPSLARTNQHSSAPQKLAPR